MGKLAAKLLGIWRSEPQEAPPPSLEGVQSEVERLRATIADLQLQWAEVLDKLASWGNRQAARDRARVRQSLSASPGDEEEPGGVPVAPPPSRSRQRGTQLE